MTEVKIYSTPICPFCIKAKAFFTEHNIPYEDYNVADDIEKRKEMVEKSGKMSVPIIDIDGKIFEGFDPGELSKVLGIAEKAA